MLRAIYIIYIIDVNWSNTFGYTKLFRRKYVYRSTKRYYRLNMRAVTLRLFDVNLMFT